ncbi:MAG: hypothetical protein ACI8R9_002849 [Paraglaciecola sp.]
MSEQRAIALGIAVPLEAAALFAATPMALGLDTIGYRKNSSTKIASEVNFTARPRVKMLCLIAEIQWWQMKLMGWLY